VAAPPVPVDEAAKPDAAIDPDAQPAKRNHVQERRAKLEAIFCEVMVTVHTPGPLVYA
jgi:hypothetical protein